MKVVVTSVLSARITVFLQLTMHNSSFLVLGFRGLASRNHEEDFPLFSETCIKNGKKEW